MHAYIKDCRLDSFSEEFFPKPVPEKFEDLIADDGSGTVIGRVSVSPEVPGLVYDEAIEFDLDETPVYEDGKIVPYSESRKKAEDDAEAERKRAESAKVRKSEILAEIGRLGAERDGLAMLGGTPEDANVAEITARIETLRQEYASITA